MCADVRDKLTMVCKTAWDILGESMGFSNEFCECFKSSLGTEYDR